MALSSSPLSVTADPMFTSWAGDDAPPPSPLALNPVIFRRHSTEFDNRKARADTMDRHDMDDPDFCRISFGDGFDEDDLVLGDNIQSRRERGDLTTLVEFLKNNPPPPDNFMSIPYGHEREKDRGKWAKLKRVGKIRSKSVPRAPKQIRLPDSAVSGTTIGGHRHIAISIPVEAMPFEKTSDSQYSVYSKEGQGAESKSSAEPKNMPIRTYTNENGVVTVLRPTSGNAPAPLARHPGASSRPLLPSSSDKQAYGQPSRNHQKSSSQSTAGSIGRRNQDYISIFPHRTDTPLASEAGTSWWGPAHARQSSTTGGPQNAREFQRSAYPARGSSMGAGRRFPHPMSIDGLISLYGDVQNTPSGYNSKPLPKPPALTKAEASGVGPSKSKRRAAFPSPISERSNEGSSVRSRGHTVKIILDHPVSTTPSKENSPPSTPGSIQSRREKVRDKKKRDMEALRNAKLKGQDGHSGDELPIQQQSTDDSDAKSITEHVRQPSQNALCPIMVVVDVEPSAESPAESRGIRHPHPIPAPETPKTQTSASEVNHVNHLTPPKSIHGSPLQKRLTGHRDWDVNALKEEEEEETQESAPAARTRTKHDAGGGVSHQRTRESQTDKKILRLYDTYRENRMRDVERRVRRLERNGDVWLRALVPVLDDMNRTIKAVCPGEAARGGEAREWASDDEVAGVAERKSRKAGKRRAAVRRISLSPERLGRRDDSEGSDSVSRSDEVGGLGSIEPMMRELASEARRRQKQVEARYHTVYE